MKKVFISILFLLPACAAHYPAQVTRTESLINQSDEKISFPITDADSVTDIEKWVKSGDTPSKAELSCKDTAKTCKSVKALLKKHKIAFESTSSSEKAGNLSLTYSHITDKACSTSSLGCATSANSLKMITNREQLINPSLSDPQDAVRAIKAIR